MMLGRVLRCLEECASPADVCAECNGSAVLSLDEHFWIVSGEGKLKMHLLE
jgi:hypothetical protein